MPYQKRNANEQHEKSQEKKTYDEQIRHKINWQKKTPVGQNSAYAHFFSFKKR